MVKEVYLYVPNRAVSVHFLYSKALKQVYGSLAIKEEYYIDGVREWAIYDMSFDVTRYKIYLAFNYGLTTISHKITKFDIEPEAIPAVEELFSKYDTQKLKDRDTLIQLTNETLDLIDRVFDFLFREKINKARSTLIEHKNELLIEGY